MIQSAAITYVGLAAAVIVFQLCLLAGAPWGRLTQGGRHQGVLPASGRVAAGVSVVLLVCMAAGIASAADMPPYWPQWTGWAAVAVQTLSTIANWATPSRPERRLWGPVTALMLVLAGLVMLGGIHM